MTEELANGKNFAAVTTVLPSGRLQTQVLWAGLKDGQLVLNTETRRRRYKNLRLADEGGWDHPAGAGRRP